MDKMVAGDLESQDSINEFWSRRLPLTQQSTQHQRNNPHVHLLIDHTSAIFEAIFKSFVEAELDTNRRAIFGAFVERLRPRTRPKIVFWSRQHKILLSYLNRQANLAAYNFPSLGPRQLTILPKGADHDNMPNPLPCEIEEHIEKMTIETTNEKANEEIPSKSVYDCSNLRKVTIVEEELTDFRW
jgi:hypothetical protein